MQPSPSEYNLTLSCALKPEELFDKLSRIPGYDWQEKLTEEGMQVEAAGHWGTHLTITESVFLNDDADSETEGDIVISEEDEKWLLEKAAEHGVSQDELINEAGFLDASEVELQELIDQPKAGERRYWLHLQFHYYDLQERYTRWRFLRQAITSALSARVIHQTFQTFSFRTPCPEKDMLTTLQRATGLQWTLYSEPEPTPKQNRFWKLVVERFPFLSYVEWRRSLRENLRETKGICLEADRGDGCFMSISGNRSHYRLEFDSPEGEETNFEAVWRDTYTHIFSALQAVQHFVPFISMTPFGTVLFVEKTLEQLHSDLSREPAFKVEPVLEDHGYRSLFFWLHDGTQIDIRKTEEDDFVVKAMLDLSGKVEDFRKLSLEEELLLDHCYLVSGNFATETPNPTAAWDALTARLGAQVKGEWLERYQYVSFITTACDYPEIKAALLKLQEKFPTLTLSCSRGVKSEDEMILMAKDNLSFGMGSLQYESGLCVLRLDDLRMKAGRKAFWNELLAETLRVTRGTESSLVGI